MVEDQNYTISCSIIEFDSTSKDLYIGRELKWWSWIKDLTIVQARMNNLHFFCPPLKPMSTAGVLRKCFYEVQCTSVNFTEELIALVK